MKLTLIHPLDPLGPRVGGIKTFIKGMIRYAPEDFALEFIGISSNPIQRRVLEWNTINLENKRVKFFPLLADLDENIKKRIPLSFRFAMRLRQIHLDQKPRVSIFHRIEPVLFYKSSAEKTLAIIHDDIEKQVLDRGSESTWRHFPRIYNFMEKMAQSRLNHVYTVSSNALDYYQKKYSNEAHKFSFLPTWADPSKFFTNREDKKALRNQFLEGKEKIPVDEPWLLFVGRLQIVKDPDLLIQAFQKYADQKKQGVLLIIGEGNLKLELERKVKDAGIQERVFFLGSLLQENLAKLYQAADCLILTSHFESMPMSVLEALSCGLPVVSTPVGELRKVVRTGESGVICSDHSVESVVKGILEVLENPNRYTSSKCEYAASKFTPQKILPPFFEECRKLVEE